MDTKETISKEMKTLSEEGKKILKSFDEKKDKAIMYNKYQRWYTQALRVVNVLASDRYAEFKSYYEIAPERKTVDQSTYVIQDYLKGIVLNSRLCPDFDPINFVSICFFNQLRIFESLSERVDSVLANIDCQIFSELQDAELEKARQLMKTSVRASGALAGVVIESYLQKLAKNHGIPIKKKNPTISDLNDPLKNEGVFDIPTWRKVTYLADIRNICSHKKDKEPTKEQVTELIDGANWLIKNVF